MLVDPGSLAVIPGMQQASAMYKVAKSATRRTNAVSPCLKQWFTCLTDPFSPAAAGSCIPSGGNHSSARNFGFTRFDITVGSAGYALVAIAPTPSNNSACLFYSTAAWAGASTQLLTANNTLVVGLTTLSIPSNRYSYAQLGSAVLNPYATARLVGGGFRVQYTGTNLNLGGLMYIYTSPTHASSVDDPVSSTAYDAAELGGFQECIIKPVTREPQEFPLSPLIERELEYATAAISHLHTYPWANGTSINGFTYSSGAGNIGNPTTSILITGVPGETFHFEYGMHVESVGPLTQGQRKPAESDPIGVDALMAAMSNAQISVASSMGSYALALKKEYHTVVANRSATASL